MKTKSKRRLKLAGIVHPLLFKQARDGARLRNWDRIFGSADSQASMYLMGLNAQYFRDHDAYEAALLIAWVNQKTSRVCINGTWWDWNIYMKDWLHRQCERAKLRAASDPLPELPDPITVYRGAAPDKDMRGVSWSLDRSVAEGFSRSQGDGKTVWTTQIQRDQIYAYVSESGRNERETMLVLPDDWPVEEIGV